MSKPTGIQKKHPTASKCRTLFRPHTHPTDHASSSPRTESMPYVDLQSSPALRVTPDLEAVPGLVGTPAEPDSKVSATTDDGSDTEEEDNSALEEHYLNKHEVYERRVETVLGDGLRIWKSMGGTWYTCIEGEVIEGHAMLPAKWRQRSFKETPSAGRHSSSAVHTDVKQSKIVKQSSIDEQSNLVEQSNAVEQINAVEQSNTSKQSISFEQPISLEQSISLEEQFNVFEQPTTVNHSNIITRPTTVKHSRIFKQPTTVKHRKARPSPTKHTKPTIHTFMTGITKPKQPPSRTPAPTLATALAHRTRDATHFSTIFHHGSAAINPLGAHARSVPHKVAPPSLALLALQEPPVTDQQQNLATRRGIDTPSTLVLGGTGSSQHADDLDTEYPPTAHVYSTPPRSAVAHLTLGGSPAASPTTAHVSPATSTASPRRVTSGSFGTFEGSPGRFDERKYRHFPAGKAVTNSAVDATADATLNSSGSPAKANRVAWLRGHEG
jgi:hypothetical protein